MTLTLIAHEIHVLVTEKQRKDVGNTQKSCEPLEMTSARQSTFFLIRSYKFIATKFLYFMCKTAGAKTCRVSRSRPRSANDHKMADLCESRQFQTFRRHCVSFPHPESNYQIDVESTNQYDVISTNSPSIKR